MILLERANSFTNKYKAKEFTRMIINHNLDISVKELELLFQEINNKTRFSEVRKEDKKLFDLASDSDVIFTDFLKTYPSIVSKPSDIQNMNYWLFLILLNGVVDSISNRVSIRGKEINSKLEAEDRQRIASAKNAIQIEPYFNYNSIFNYIKRR